MAIACARRQQHQQNRRQRKEYRTQREPEPPGSSSPCSEFCRHMSGPRHQGENAHDEDDCGNHSRLLSIPDEEYIGITVAVTTEATGARPNVISTALNRNPNRGAQAAHRAVTEIDIAAMRARD